jgi:signal transduction histidine kinase
VKKVALLFLLAVFVPSLVLAYLAVRSVRAQQILLERQQTLLYQGVTDALAKEIHSYLTQNQREFATQVESFVGSQDPRLAAAQFDDWLIKSWPIAEVGFAVTTDGSLLAPALLARSEARQFRLENDQFLTSQEAVQIYFPSNAWSVTAKPEVVEADFRKLIGQGREGSIARFIRNRLRLLFWYRSTRDPLVIFGAQVNPEAWTVELQNVLERSMFQVEPALRNHLFVALRNESGRVIASSDRGSATASSAPFVRTELGPFLPHWEVSGYLNQPESLRRSAQSATGILWLVIALLLVAIGTGGWLIVADLRRELTLARQKTDFVSNVSHELKTPLTSIRMFSELLSQGRVQSDKQKSYLNIITAEAARLTRLINNVLDFARLERGEKEYAFSVCDLGLLTREILEAYRPHLEGENFTLTAKLPPLPCYVRADPDALAQVLVNLLSNAEKYSGLSREIEVELQVPAPGCPALALRICDRGLGVPRGSETKIFNKFYRAHDSLSSGIQGSGLGLTLARQIARAHGGDVDYEPRDGGGSCFVLRLPPAPKPS